jgi:ABC-2 type transport system ATP-binding protein
MSFSVQIRDLSVRYGRTQALRRVDLDLEAGLVHGLLGRNGSGKTTLLSTIAAFRRPSGGAVLVDGEDPWENPRVMAGTCLVRESGDVQAEVSMKDNLTFVAGARPHFDPELAGRLMDVFELDPRRRPSKLSRGKKSAFGAVVGLASRAELTIFDEVYLGMDAPSRYAFYDALIEDYVEHPRTIVLSSHLIDEIQRLLESVVILDAGSVLLAEDADALRGRGVSVTGPADAVDAFTTGRVVLRRRRLGRTAEVTVDGGLTPDDRATAAGLGLELGPVDLQSLFVHLTEKAPTEKEAAR